jgi:hypothetical protein
VQTTAATCSDCLCKSGETQPEGVGQGCKQFAASVFLPECPPRILVSANIEFEYWSAGGFNRGCKGMLYADPIWGRLRKGSIPVSSKLYRVQCNGTTPYSIEYKRQNTCLASPPPEFQGNATCNPVDALICPDRCQIPTGCRGYVGRDSDSPCAGTTTDRMGTEITKSLLLGLPLAETREHQCNEVYYSCTHLLGGSCSGCSQNPVIPGVNPYAGPDDTQCSGNYECTSDSYSCPACTFDIEEDPVVPHIRCAFDKTFCYTIKDFYTNCVDTFIHIPKPKLFVSEWRPGDPWIASNTQAPYIVPIQPPATGFFYPFISSLTHLRQGTFPGYSDPYPFTWGRRITNLPMCIPQGSYTMYGNMGSGLSPTVLNRCAGSCVGTNSLGGSLNFNFDDQNFTAAFTACNDYWDKNCGWLGCAGLVQGASPSFAACANNAPQCCCRPYQYEIWNETPIGELYFCSSSPDITFGGSPDPPVCYTLESSNLATSSIYPCERDGPSKVLEYLGHDSPLNQCRQGDVIYWDQEEYDYTTVECDYWECCDSNQFCFDATDEFGLEPFCGVKGWENCNGETINCPAQTCDVQPMPFPMQTKSAVSIVRPFTNQISVLWEFGAE